MCKKLIDNRIAVISGLIRNCSSPLSVDMQPCPTSNNLSISLRNGEINSNIKRPERQHKINSEQ